MENKENSVDNLNVSRDLVLNQESLGYMEIIRKWAMFFAILGCVGIGLMLLGGLIMGIASSVGAAFSGMQETWVFGVVALVYVLFAGLYVMPVIYLFKFSTKMKTALEKSDQSSLVVALQNLKSHFKYVGIMIISIMGLYIVAIVVFMIVGAAAMF